MTKRGECQAMSKWLTCGRPTAHVSGRVCPVEGAGYGESRCAQGTDGGRR